MKTRLHVIKNKVLKAIFFIFLSTTISHSQINWTGNTSTDFYDITNWDDQSIDFANLQGTTIVVKSGSPYNPIQNGGNTNNINYRPGTLNVADDGNLTLNGNLLPWNSSYLNGTVTLGSLAYINIRNTVHIGKYASGTLTMNGGSLHSKNGFYIGYGAGGSALVNVYGGTLYAGSSLDIATGSGSPTATVNIDGGAIEVGTFVNIGENGEIIIGGIGSLIVNGDHVSTMNAYISDGKLYNEVGKTLEVTYANGRTTVSIPQDPNSMLKEYASYIILDNGIVEAKIAKGSGDILSMKVNGVETVAQSGNRTGAYYDFTSSKGFEKIFGATFSVKEETEDYIDVSFNRPYKPGENATPCDADIHFVLKKNDTGLYTYSILNHKETYPDFDLGSWRQVMWIAHDGTNFLNEKIYVSDLKNWEMASQADNSAATVTGIQEIIKLNTGVRAGKYDGKYQYCEPLIDIPAYGHASDINKIGSWAVFGSHEYFNSGPTHHDLNAAAGIIHICMNGVHYNSRGFLIEEGESWSKIYGPYLLYTSSGNTGDENWADAKERAEIDKAEWPFEWLTNTPDYPLAAERGNITGNFSITDPLKPEVNGNGAWIGVTQLSDSSDGQWQFEEENYQYWVKTDASGNFDIKNVRPGTYTLFAFNEGAINEYRMENVTVSAGNTTGLGNVNWDIPRENGNLVWEIGVPNRTAEEYKFGDFDYCEGYVQDKFFDTFSNPIEYDVVAENWETVLPYAHSSFFKENGSLEAWNWRLNFNLVGDVPTEGYAKLTIAYASADHAQQWIYVNNENATPIYFYPPIGGGNAFLRQSNHAKYGVQVVDIPMSKLRSGENTITLKMPSASYSGNHIMYDYISLEGNISMSTLDVKDYDASKSLIEVYPNPTSDVINIRLKDNKTQYLSVSIYNFLGQNVLEKHFSQNDVKVHTIDIKGRLAPGAHFVKVKTDTNTYFSKIIIE